MYDPNYYMLLEAGYQPDQILSCWPCKCKETDSIVYVKDCIFPTHKGGEPIVKEVK